MACRRITWLTILILVESTLYAQSVTKISATEGGFTGELDDFGHFASGLATIGDLDGDGLDELAVGGGEVDGGGVVWILFLNRDGSVRKHQKIGQSAGGFEGPLSDGDGFGSEIADLGDFDGDGTPDIVVSAGGTGEDNHGAIWILCLNPDATVKSQLQIHNPEWDELESGEGEGDTWGSGLAVLGDLDRDGVQELAVGAFSDRTNGIQPGAAWIISVDGSGEVHQATKITTGVGGFDGNLGHLDLFGQSIISLGDLDGDDVTDIAVGASRSDAGSVWVLFLNADGTVKQEHEIFSVDLGAEGAFGISLSNLGDLDSNDVDDIAVGAHEYPAVGASYGSVWILFLNSDGTVGSYQSISQTSGPVAGLLDREGNFGSSIATLDDIDGDGVPELAVGASGSDDGGREKGAVWILFGLPTPTAFSASNEEALSGQDAPIVVQIADAGGIGAVEINFRRGGDPTFFSTPMTSHADGTYTASIPAFVVGARGVEYFVTASDNTGSETRLPTTGVLSVPVRVPDGYDVPLPSGETVEAYRLVSIPLDLDADSAAGVLLDDLGTPDQSQWRVFGPDAGLTELTAQGIDLSLAPGRTLWMLSRIENRVFNSGPGVSVRTDQPFEIALSRGWNLIGNPFNFPVPLSSLSLRSTPSLDIRRFEGSWTTQEGALQPFEGYAVFAERSDVLTINPDVTSQQSVALSRPEAAMMWERTSQLEALTPRLDEAELPRDRSPLIHLTSYPNPLSTSTTIQYQLSEPAQVELAVYDLLGGRVATLQSRTVKSAGVHTAEWQARSLSGVVVASGTYFYRLRIGEIVHSGQMLVAR